MTADTRPLTAPERRTLEWHRSRLIGGGLQNLLAGSGCGAGCLMVPLVLVMSIIGPLKWNRFWDSTPEGGTVRLSVLAAFAVLFLGALVFGLLQRRKKRAELAVERSPIESDLVGGVARVHRFRATAVILAYRGKDRERTYFVRLDDGRILCLACWRPPTWDLRELSCLPDERDFPSATFEIAAGPESLLILDVVGTGEYLRPVDEFDLGPKPPKTPFKLDPGSFVDVPWEDLRKSFG